MTMKYKTTIVLLVAISFISGVWFGVKAPSSQLFRHVFSWQTSLVTDSQQVGDQIVNALKQHFNDQGQYPIQLSDLLQKYLDRLLDPLAGDKKWRYETDREGSWFQLSFAFDNSEYPNCIFYSDGESWEEDR